MKIKIEADGYHFSIRLPIGIIMNGFTAKIIKNCLKKYVEIPFTEEHFYAIFRELKQAKKTFPDLTLVDVKTADERVLITL